MYTTPATPTPLTQVLDTRIRVHKGRTVAALTGALLVGVAAYTVCALLAPPVSTPPTEVPPPSTPACAVEDDTACFWDASTQGNGIGDSFYADAEGNRYYLKSNCADKYRDIAYDTIHNVAIPRVENDANSNSGIDAYEFANATIANAAELSNLEYGECK